MSKEKDQILVDELKEILNEREGRIFENYQIVRNEYKKEYGWPELDTLRYEAALAIIFDLNQAAITFVNHMLEALLKTSIGYFDAFEDFKKGNQDVQDDKSIKSMIDQLSPSFKNVDGKNLNNTIDMAFERSLITNSQRDQLHIYRQTLRNAYSHADKKKTFGDMEIPIQGFHMNEDYEFEMESKTDQKVSDLPFVQGIAQYYHAKENAIQYFKYVDSLARQIRELIFPEENIMK